MLKNVLLRGDVTRFEKRTSLTAFAGVDPQTNESGDKMSKSVPTSKKLN
ncbi:MAG: transposase [Synergistaceae bacterium]|nr:transposase [Synergistaceae bacterium]